MSQNLQCSFPLSSPQESYQRIVLLNQQKGPNLQNQLFRSSVSTGDQKNGTSEILITRVVGNMQPAAAYVWNQPLSLGHTPVSSSGDHHAQPATPCLTPCSLESQASSFQYPSTVNDNPTHSEMMPTLPQQKGPNLFPLQNQLFRSSISTADQKKETVGTITKVVGNMQPAAACVWNQPLLLEHTPISSNNNHHTQPTTPYLRPCSLKSQASLFQYPSTVNDNPTHSEMMPALPHLRHPQIKPDPDVENATNVCKSSHQPTYPVEFPNNLPMAGQFNFHLHFIEEGKDISKCALLTYSNVLKRLFIKQNQKIPLTFKLCDKIPMDSYIRAMTIFKTPEMIREIVTTCPKHKADIASQSLEHPEHFIRNENDSAIYQKNSNGRLSVLVPLKSLQTNQGSYIALFNFPCFSSCLPKNSRNLVQIVFTLEYRNHVLGQACVDIRVCSSPNSYRKLAEMTTDTPPTNKKCKKGTNTGIQSRSNNVEPQPCPVPLKKVMATVFPPGDDHVQQPQKKMYYVAMDSKEVYYVLMTMKNTIEPFYNPYTGNSGQVTLGESELSSQVIFRYVDKWLDHIDMGHYKNAFKGAGVTNMFQIESFGEMDLQMLGITNTCDITFLLNELENHRIEQACYTQYSPSYYSPSSQGDSQLESQPLLDYTDYNTYKGTLPSYNSSL